MTKKQDWCPNCGGHGYNVEEEQIGEDSYGYAITEPVQAQCGYCGGSGVIEVNKEENRDDRK